MPFPNLGQIPITRMAKLGIDSLELKPCRQRVETTKFCRPKAKKRRFRADIRMCQHLSADNCLPAFFRLFGYLGYILPEHPYILGPIDMKGISSN